MRTVAIVLLLAVAAFAVGNCDGAGNCYVSQIATGTGSGADWTNACTDFTGACNVTDVSLRGTTIWVGGSPGNPIGIAYKAQAFSAPDSGTTPITIIAADAENHGTETGWRRQYATAVVPLTGPISITTDYWVFNGQFRASQRQDSSSPLSAKLQTWLNQGGGTYHDQYFGYHLMVANASGTANGGVQISGSHVTIKYMYVQGSATATVTAGGQYGQSISDNGVYFSPGVTDEYFGYSWIAFTGADSIYASSGSNFTFEYDMFSKNHMGAATSQSQAISIGDLTNLIVRYNHFHDITGSAIITDSHTDGTAFTPNWYVYGNDIFWGTVSTVVHSGAGYGLSSGILNLTGETLNGGVIHVYNNTIAGINVPACTSTQPCNTTALNLNGTTGGSCAAHTQNCIGATAPVGTVYNNLWWNPYQAANVAVNTAANPQWTPTGDYGEGICATTGCTNGGSFTVVGANDVVSNTGNPFVQYDGTMGGICWYRFSFALTADTAPGLAIPNWTTTPASCNLNCESNDPVFADRSNNGTIDRGSFQRQTRRLLAVATQNLAAGVHVGSTFQEVPVCTWSSAPTTDPCPDSVAPYIKQWSTTDAPVATVNSSGLVTGVSPHNAFIKLQYGGISTLNGTTIVVSDGLGNEPIATLPTGIVRTGSPLAFSGYDTTQFDANFPTVFSDPCPNGATGCTRWKPTNATEFQADLNNAAPGDSIELAVGTTYATPGVFMMPVKVNPNNKWIYILSSNMASLPPQGTRVSPADAVNMPKVVETAGSGLMAAAPGATHYWIAGLELTTNGAFPAAAGTMVTGNNVNTYDAMPDSITVDRCYMHTTGAPGVGMDLRRTVTMNGSHFALLDSYLGPGLSYHTQAQAATSFFSPGPYKVINNFFSAFGEDMIIGGAGGFSSQWVTSDVYIHNNTFWKDPAWRAPLTIPPSNPYEIVDNFELKICRRCLIDGNLMQNSWASAQDGGSIVFNSGTGVNGPDAVIDDITFSNNIVMGALQGMGGTEFAANNNGCDFSQSPCQYPGESRRVNYLNNLSIQGPQGPPGGRLYIGASTNMATTNRIQTDLLWQHNTLVGPYLTDHLYCERGFYLANLNNNDVPGTQNAWFLDNVSCRQLQGATGQVGMALLNGMMSDPASPPIGTRFYGNLMQYFTAQGDHPQTWPTGNQDTATNFVYNSPTTGDYTLQQPQLQGSDNQQTGINYSVIQAHQKAPLGTCSIAGTVSGSIASGVLLSVTGPTTFTTWSNADGTYTIPNLAGGAYTVTPFAVVPVGTTGSYTFNPTSIPITLTSPSCTSTANNFQSLAAATYSISGTITLSGGGGQSGVSVGLTGTSTGTTTTNTSGSYTFSGLGPGSYTIKPSLAGFTYSPATLPETISTADITGANFTASPAATYTIAGTITGVVVSGISVQLSGAGAGQTFTDANGNYSFANEGTGTYSVMPSLAGYTFSPANQSVTVSNANVTVPPFTSAAVTYAISGTISGAVSSGVTVRLSNGNTTITTTSGTNGAYTFTTLPNGNYQITPSLTGYSFTPTSLGVSISGSNVTGQNFNSSAIVAGVGAAWQAGHIGPSTTKTKQSKPK